MLQRAAPVPMAQAEKAAVLSALTLMMTSGLPGAAAPQCTVASAATPSGDAGSGTAQEASVIGEKPSWRMQTRPPTQPLSAAQGRQGWSLLPITGKTAPAEYKQAQCMQGGAAAGTLRSPSDGMLKRTDLRFLAASLAFTAGLDASEAGLGAAVLAAAPGLVLRKPAQGRQTVSHLSILRTCGTQRRRSFQINQI